MKQQQSQLLKAAGLSVTAGREKILQVFAGARGALAHTAIEKKTAAFMDRVTVYRTLQTFVDSGLIHKIPTTENTILYALCSHQCTAEKHTDDHVHFVCSHCDKTICMDSISVPLVKLPKHFRQQHAAMTVTGRCGDCV